VFCCYRLAASVFVFDGDDIIELMYSALTSSVLFINNAKFEMFPEKKRRKGDLLNGKTSIEAVQ